MAQNSNKPEESKSKSLKDTPPPPLPFAHQIKGEAKEEKRGKDDDITVEDALKMLTEMKKTYEKMDLLASQALEATGWTPKYLKNYLDNPSNFPDAEAWAAMQKQRKELRDSIKSPEELQEEEKKNPLLRENMPHDPQIAKERRSKTVGQRRNWLPMR